MKIRGNIVSTNMKRPDFHQTNERKSDFIKNNPLPIITPEDEGKMLLIKEGKLVPIASRMTPIDKEEIVGEIKAMFPVYKEEILNALIASFPVYIGEVGQYE